MNSAYLGKKRIMFIQGRN